MAITLAIPNDRPVPFIDLVPQFDGMSAEIMSVVEKVFAEQKFILGDEVSSLENEIATYCDARHAIACNSGTDALIIALQAMGIGEGDEVITTPFSFFATASSICRTGATSASPAKARTGVFCLRLKIPSIRTQPRREKGASA